MIRIAQEQDLPQILQIYAPYVLNTTYSFEYVPPSQEDFLERFRAITVQFPWLVWEEGGAILGYVYASAPFTRAAYDWCAEPSVYLHPQAQGKGIGKRLYAALEALLMEQGYQVLYALITQENVHSLRFHERCGYRHSVTLPNCGFKFGRWLGLTWMEKRLKPVEIPSDSPISWQMFRQDAQRISNILDNLSLS